MRTYSSLAAAASIVFLAGVSSAHIDLTDPPMRGGDQKMNPCEGEARGNNPTVYMPGETITVKWTETVGHGPGFFVVSFDPDGDDFDGDMDGTGDYPAHPNAPTYKNGDGALELGRLADDAGGAGTMNELEVTLPNIQCDNCTLQVMQMMGEDAKTPATPDSTSHIYFRCADVVLEGELQAGGAGGMAGDGGGAGDAAMAGTGGAGGATGGVPTAGTGGAVAAAGTVAAGGMTAGAGGMTMVTTTSGDDGGCAISSSRSSGAGSALAALALMSAGWFVRRRRAR